MSIILAFILSLVLTPAVVKAAGTFTSPIKEDLSEHSCKAGTCSLGSLAIVFSFAIAILVERNVVDLTYFLLCFPFFLIGLVDDVLKHKRQSPDGFKSITKLLLQLLSSLLVAIYIRDHFINLSPYFYYPLCVLFISATVNAMNITDGLDGLAAKVCMPSLVVVAFSVQALASANLTLLAILAAWLVYNSKKASIFMGDGGSHFLGAFVALNALFSTRVEGVILANLVIYVELLSSFIQIVSIRGFKKKVFLIAPLHHDLEKRGMGEEKIVDTFFAFSIFFSLLSAIVIFRIKI